MTKNEKQIRLRCVTPGLPNNGNGIRYYVTHENDVVMHIDNRASDRRFRSSAVLSKLSNGNLANSAGQEFEIVAEAK
jgi:hypothetical protein